MKIIAPILFFLASACMAGESSPDCAGVENWAAGSAYAQLKNQGMVSPETVNFKKTKVLRIASEKIGKDLYRQVHQITFSLKGGHEVEVITVNDASSEECSMSEVKIYVVSKTR